MTSAVSGTKHFLDSIEDQSFKKGRSYLFDGQSALAFATIRSEIESHFVQNNCSELVSRGPDEVPNPTEN